MNSLSMKTRWRTSLLTALFLFTTGCQPQATGESPSAKAAVDNDEVEMTAVEGLQIKDLVVGDGPQAESGKNIVVHYTGWLFDPDKSDNKGVQFDSSVDRNQPFQFPLGAGRVIAGWDQGFDGMQVGGKRVLLIPPELGYGTRGAGAAIPPNATLLFEVELLDVR